MARFRWIQFFGTFQVAVPRGGAPARPGIDAQPDAIGVETPSGVIEIRAVVVRLAPVEERRLELHGVPQYPRRQHAGGGVRDGLPVVPDRSERVVRRGRAMR